MVEQILFLIAVVAGGAYLGYWLRRFEMSGFEFWFPVGLIVSYAISPVVGFIVAFAMMLITWALFPYGLHCLAISAATMLGVFFLTMQFPVTEATFLRTGLILALTFHGVSNFFYFVTGYPWIRILKFIMLNLFLCWIIFSKGGWGLLLWLAA